MSDGYGKGTITDDGLNQYQRKKLEITNLYKESEEVEFGKYINLFLQKEQNIKKGSLNHLILKQMRHVMVEYKM